MKINNYEAFTAVNKSPEWIETAMRRAWNEGYTAHLSMMGVLKQKIQERLSKLHWMYKDLESHELPLAKAVVSAKIEELEWLLSELEGYTAAKGEGWVSAEERKPELITNVLVVQKVGDHYSEPLMAHFCGEGFNVMKYTPEGGRIFVTYWADVTHWMKLPEAPKPELKQ